PPAAQTSLPTVTATNPYIIRELKHDETAVSLREMPPAPAGITTQVPPVFSITAQTPNTNVPGFVSQTVAASSITPVPILNFEGLGYGLPSTAPIGFPPDTNLSVGTDQFVETINLQFAVFNKSTGSLLYGPTALSTLWGGFDGSCESIPRGDPVVVFD